MNWKKYNIKYFIAGPGLPWLIAAALLILILLFIFRKVPVPGENPTEEYLKKQNDSLKREGAKDKEAQIRYQRSIDSLNTVIGNIDQKIITIKETYEKRILVYDTFTVEQLTSYLTDRAKRNHSKIGSDINR